jgi:hypothetical protein
VQPEAINKFDKACEFLSVAEVALAGGCFDAAVSLAVSAVINASDVLCMEITGNFPSGQSHDGAFAILRKCGNVGESVSRHLRGALKMKNKSQYSTARCRENEAEGTYRHAERAIDLIKSWDSQRN